MDTFIVSARKYRPQLFDTVVGQSHITTTLKNAIRHQQLAHAFLFCGPRGVGKTTCARILAKTINCENQTRDGEACNKCHSCLSFNEGSSMNIHELDAASNNSVDDIRSLVDQVRFAPQAGKYKVYIIDEVHMLSSAAFNAFLKTLEEPPPYAIFILATTEKHKILPTILSRCQIFDFKRITTNDTVEHLVEICGKESISAEKAALQVIAQKSEGCMRDALSIMDKIVSFTNGELTYSNTLEHLNILDADYYFRLLEAMQQQDLSGALLLYDDINRKGFEGDMVLNGFAEFFRNLLVCKDEKVAGLLEVVESFRDKYISVARQTPTAWLISALNSLSEAEISFKAARNKRLHVELALIKLTYLQQALEISMGDESLVKKKRIAEARPVAFRRITPLVVQAAEKAPRETTKPEAKLLVEVPASATAKPPEAPRPTAASAPPPVSGKTGSISLQNIRKQFSNKTNLPVEKPIDLDQASLENYWQEYINILKTQKNPAAASFEIALLRVTGPSSFEVITHNNLEQKFIEQERISLSEFLLVKYNNKNLVYAILIDDSLAQELPEQPTLSTRDQFIAIAGQYPKVKELMDRLRLELDY